MNQLLKELNQLSPDEAQDEFLKCCGARRWAVEMTATRPFADFDELTAAAERIWWRLSQADWLEAFRAHPKIGEKKSTMPQPAEAQSWSTREQSGVQSAAPGTKAALAEGNRQYEERFGFLFIVCATGKSAEEMLSMLEQRLKHDRKTELQIAAQEQSKITRLRLEKLLSQ